MEVKVIDRSVEAIHAKERAVRAALNAAGLVAEGYAKVHLEQTPRRVDTGRLRNSISHRAHDDRVEIGTNVEYAIYVEFGTRRMKPNNFLRSAVGDHLPEYREILKEYLKGK